MHVLSRGLIYSLEVVTLPFRPGLLKTRLPLLTSFTTMETYGFRHLSTRVLLNYKPII